MVRIGGLSIELIRGDITELGIDAIVNPANSRLKHGAGVAGAIVRKGGYVIQKESDKLGFCAVGSAVITNAGKLRAKYVIHAVGPVNGEGDEDAKLRSATLSVLRLADKHGLKSVAFPAISTGAFGFPKDRCAKVMLKAAIEHAKSATALERIVFCLYDDDTLRIFADTLKEMT